MLPGVVDSEEHHTTSTSEAYYISAIELCNVLRPEERGHLYVNGSVAERSKALV